MRIDQARAYVEDLLERMLGVERLVSDDDGDYPVRYREASYYVRLVQRREAVVQIFSTPVIEVEMTPALLEDLNTIDGEISFARAFWVRGQVLIETEVLADSLDLETFENSCSAVGQVSLRHGPTLHECHGGQLRFLERPEDEERTVATGNAVGIGQYL